MFAETTPTTGLPPYRSKYCQHLLNNRGLEVKWFASLQQSFKWKPEMQDQYVSFMEKIFTNGHTEVAPPLDQDEDCWYRPSFGVYPPQKPNQIRVVSDPSAQYSELNASHT